MNFRCFREKNPHHDNIICVKEIITIEQCIRERGLEKLRVSFGESSSTQLIATLHLNLTNCKLSKNEITGFILNIPNDAEYTICEERAAEELHELLIRL